MTLLTTTAPFTTRTTTARSLRLSPHLYHVAPSDYKPDRGKRYIVDVSPEPFSVARDPQSLSTTHFNAASS